MNDVAQTTDDVGSPDSQSGHDLRPAVFGLVGVLVGALISGVATFGASWWTQSEVRTQAQSTARGSAYVDFVGAVERAIDVDERVGRAITDGASMPATLKLFSLPLIEELTRVVDDVVVRNVAVRVHGNQDAIVNLASDLTAYFQELRTTVAELDSADSWVQSNERDYNDEWFQGRFKDLVTVRSGVKLCWPSTPPVDCLREEARYVPGTTHTFPDGKFAGGQSRTPSLVNRELVALIRDDASRQSR